MVYSYKALKERYGSNYKIQKATKEGKLFKIENGIYSDKEKNHYLEIFVTKYPNAIISGDSAYYYHNLTDVIPQKISMTTRRTSGRFNDKHINQSFSIDSLLNLGKTTLDYEGININIYNKERMLLELMKNKNSTSYDYYKEIINNYRRIKEDIDVYTLQEYSNFYKNGSKLMKMIEDEVF